MLNPEQKYTVFISSTYEDLKEERTAAMMAVLHMGHIPIGMELFGAVNMKVFEYIKKAIDNCDYYILIIGGRYGSVGESGLSYTEMEYDHAVQRGIPVTAVVHGDIDNLHSSRREKDPSMRRKLDAFIQKVKNNCHVGSWINVSDIKTHVNIGLLENISMYPRDGWRRISEYKLSQEKKAESMKVHGILLNATDPICFYHIGNTEYYDDDGYLSIDPDIASISLMDVLRVFKTHFISGLREKDVYDILYKYLDRYNFDKSFADITSELTDLGLVKLYTFDEYYTDTDRRPETFWRLTPLGKQVLMQVEYYK